MKFLHTSDWHLGRSLYGHKRYEEFTAFLDWLTQTIEDKKIDTLLVAGDVFDTSTPVTGRRSFTIVSFAGLRHPAVVMLLSLQGTMIHRHF